jgi:hypothetical protein
MILHLVTAQAAALGCVLLLRYILVLFCTAEVTMPGLMFVARTRTEGVSAARVMAAVVCAWDQSGDTCAMKYNQAKNIAVINKE